jgi:hypothetical protein
MSRPTRCGKSFCRHKSLQPQTRQQAGWPRSNCSGEHVRVQPQVPHCTASPADNDRRTEHWHCGHRNVNTTGRTDWADCPAVVFAEIKSQPPNVSFFTSIPYLSLNRGRPPRGIRRPLGNSANETGDGSSLHPFYTEGFMDKNCQVSASSERDDRAKQLSPPLQPKRPACPACGGPLIEIKQKLQCANCRTICETCCEGGPG